MKGYFYLIIFLFLLSACQSSSDDTLPKVGFLDAFEDQTLGQATQGFLDALEKAGYSEEKGTVKILYRNAQNDIPTLNQILDYFLSQNVDLIATNPSISTISTVQRTQNIPIFMMVSPTPKNAGLLDKSGVPPANLFGVYDDLAYVGTSVKLIKEVFPKAQKVGMIFNQAETQSVVILEEVKKQAKSVGLAVETLPVTNSNDTQLVVQSLVSKEIDVFFALADNVVFASFEEIYSICSSKDIPIFTSEEGLVLRGAVMAYGADMYRWGEQAGEQAAQFLKTGKTNDLSTEKVDLHRKVYNRAEAEKYQLSLGEDFIAVGEKLEKTKEDKKSSNQSLFLTAILRGLAFSALALGIFISMRIFDIPDITTDGSYTLGGAITAILLVTAFPNWLILPIVIVGGALAGMVTGFIHTKLEVNALLAGILVMTALYSINLIVMGQSNIPLNDVESIFDFWSFAYSDLLVLLLFTFILWGFMTWILKTDFGLAMRATGNAENMIRAFGVNTQRMKIIGLAMANALVALSGYLLVQFNGFADIHMGIGIVIVGLGSVMIGEALSTALGIRNITLRLLTIIAGTILFRLILAFTLYLGIDSRLLKLVTATFVLLAVALPILQKKGNFFKK